MWIFFPHAKNTPGPLPSHKTQVMCVKVVTGWVCPLQLWQNQGWAFGKVEALDWFLGNIASLTPPKCNSEFTPEKYDGWKTILCLMANFQGRAVKLPGCTNTKIILLKFFRLDMLSLHLWSTETICRGGKTGQTFKRTTRFHVWMKQQWSNTLHSPVSHEDFSRTNLPNPSCIWGVFKPWGSDSSTAKTAEAIN